MKKVLAVVIVLLLIASPVFAAAGDIYKLFDGAWGRASLQGGRHRQSIPKEPDGLPRGSEVIGKGSESEAR